MSPEENILIYHFIGIVFWCKLQVIWKHSTWKIKNQRSKSNFDDKFVENLTAHKIVQKYEAMWPKVQDVSADNPNPDHFIPSVVKFARQEPFCTIFIYGEESYIIGDRIVRLIWWLGLDPAWWEVCRFNFWGFHQTKS